MSERSVLTVQQQNAGCWCLQVYAHTSSELQRLVLSMMLRQDCVLPNLYVGTLTRDKFLEALDLGLAAAEVTTFLQQHAHPEVSRRVPCVPEVSC